MIDRKHEDLLDRRRNWLRKLDGEILALGDEVVVRWGGLIAPSREIVRDLRVGANLPKNRGAEVQSLPWPSLTDHTTVIWFENDLMAYGFMLYPDRLLIE